jgi:succinoglycan biosynthesis protein ExoM
MIDSFSFSVIVVDNDSLESAKNTVLTIQKNSRFPIHYYVEKIQNIAMARNVAVQKSTGDFVCFIDDDEFPSDDWLYNLYKAFDEYQPDGVLGPVKPFFEIDPPRWIIKGKLCERPTYKTGTILDWKDTRTGNVFFKRQIFSDKKYNFDSSFGVQGEDVDLFKRLVENGNIFIWCDEAPVYEAVLPHRYKLSYYMSRSISSGISSHRIIKKDRSGIVRLKFITKSFVATIGYTLLLPFFALAGKVILIKFFLKDLHHIGKILSLFGYEGIQQRKVL